jgi:hypothetical protein
MDGRERNLLERGVRALERLVALSEVQPEIEEQMDGGAPPSVCPFCEQENPSVVELATGVGPVDEYVLVAETECCNKKVFCVPVQMLIAPSVDVALEWTQMKKGGVPHGVA